MEWSFASRLLAAGLAIKSFPFAKASVLCLAYSALGRRPSSSDSRRIKWVSTLTVVSESHTNHRGNQLRIKCQYQRSSNIHMNSERHIPPTWHSHKSPALSRPGRACRLPPTLRLLPLCLWQTHPPSRAHHTPRAFPGLSLVLKSHTKYLQDSALTISS